MRKGTRQRGLGGGGDGLGEGAVVGEASGVVFFFTPCQLDRVYLSIAARLTTKDGY